MRIRKAILKFTQRTIDSHRVGKKGFKKDFAHFFVTTQKSPWLFEKSRRFSYARFKCLRMQVLFLCLSLLPFPFSVQRALLLFA